MQTATAPVARPTRSEAMIGLEPLAEIIETALFTAHLTGTIPISLIVVGPSGAGKSKMIMQYHSSNGCHLTNDVTSMGLLELLAADRDNKLTFMIIPDFNVVLSHRSSTLQLLIANLLSVTSEGTVRCDDGRVKKEAKHNPIGIVSAMTRDLYNNVARKWHAIGFHRRFLPLYYDYSFETRHKIQASIAHGQTTLLQLIPQGLHTPATPQDISIEAQAQQVLIFSDELACNMGWMPIKTRASRSKTGEGYTTKAVNIGKQLEFSPHLALRSMARAHALRAGRKEVTEEDLKFLVRLMTFTRFDRPASL